MSLNDKLFGIAKSAVDAQHKTRDGRNPVSKGFDVVTNKSYANDDKKVAAKALREWENKVWKPKADAKLKQVLKTRVKKLKPGTPEYQKTYDYLYNKNYQDLQAAKAKVQQQIGTLRKPKQSQRELDNEYRANESVRNDTVSAQAAAHAGRDAGEAVYGAIATGTSRLLRAPLQLAADVGENDNGDIFDRGAKALERHEDKLRQVYPAYDDIQKNGNFPQKLAISAVEQVPTLAASAGVAGAAAKGVQVLGAGAKATAAASYGTAAASMYPQAYLDGSDSTKDELESATAEQLASAERSQDIYKSMFDKNIKAGMSEDEAFAKARDQTISEIAEESGENVGLATLAISMLAPGVGSFTANRAAGGAVTQWGQKVFNKLAVRADAGKVAKVAIPTAVGASIVGLNVVEEGMQEGYTDYVAQDAAVDVGVKDKIDRAQNTEAVLMGGILGGLMGGGTYVGTRNSKLHQAQDDLVAAQQAYAEVAGQIPQLQQQIETVSPQSEEGQALIGRLNETKAALDAMAEQASKAGIPRTSLARRAPRVDPTNSAASEFDGQVDGATELDEQGFENALNPDATPVEQQAPELPPMSEQELNAQDAQLAELIAEQEALDEAIDDGSNEKSLEESIAAAQSWYENKRGEGKQGLAGVVSRAAATEQDAVFNSQQQAIAGTKGAINNYIAEQRAKQQQIDAEIENDALAAKTEREKKEVEQRAKQRDIDRAQENELLEQRAALAQPYENESFDTTVIGANGAPFNLARFWDSNMPAPAKAKAIADAFGGQVEQNISKADWQSMPEGVQKELHQWMTGQLDAVRRSREGAVEQTDQQATVLSVEPEQEQADATIESDSVVPAQQAEQQLNVVQNEPISPVIPDASEQTADIEQLQAPIFNESVLNEPQASIAPERYKSKSAARAAIKKQKLDPKSVDIVQETDGYAIIEASGQQVEQTDGLTVPVQEPSVDSEVVATDTIKLTEKNPVINVPAPIANESVPTVNESNPVASNPTNNSENTTAKIYKSKPAARAAIKKQKIDPDSVSINQVKGGGFEIMSKQAPKPTYEQAEKQAATELGMTINEDGEYGGTDAEFEAFANRIDEIQGRTLSGEESTPKQTFEASSQTYEAPQTSSENGSPEVQDLAATTPEVTIKDRKDAELAKKHGFENNNRLDHGELSIPNRTKNIDNELDKYKADKAKQDKREREDKRFLADERESARKPARERVDELYKQHGKFLRAHIKDKVYGTGNTPAEWLKNEAKANPEKFIKMVEQVVGESETKNQPQPNVEESETVADSPVKLPQSPVVKTETASENKDSSAKKSSQPDESNDNAGTFDGSSTELSEIASVRKQYEGTKDWMKAPNGSNTKLNEKQWLQVRTPAFKEWFGDWENDPSNASKVVDENGEPKIMYHGSPIGQTFNIFKGDDNGSIYTSDSREYANNYADDADGLTKGVSKNKKVFEVFVNSKNYFDNTNSEHVSRLADTILENNETSNAGNGETALVIDGEKSLYAKDVIEFTLQDGEGYNWRFMKEPWTQKAIKALDFDGFSVFEGDSDPAIAVYNSNQVKSATDNTGAFDSSNPDIRYSKTNPAKGLTGTTSQKIIGLLQNRFGKEMVGQLIKAGKLRVRTLNDFVDRNGRLLILSDAEGFYHQGKVVLIADNLTTNTAVATLLHELGGHAGIQNMLAPQTYMSLMESFDGLVNSGNKYAVRAKERAEASTYSDSEARDEYIPYLITEYAQASERGGPLAVIKRFVNRVMAGVRTWVSNNTGVQLKLTPNDITQLAERMVKRLAEQSASDMTIAGIENMPAAQMQFSQDSVQQANTPAFREWFDANNPDVRYSRRYSELGQDTRPTDKKGKVVSVAKQGLSASLSSWYITKLLMRRHLATPLHVSLLDSYFKIFHDNVQSRIAYENYEAGRIQEYLPEIWDTRLRVGKKKEAIEKVARAYFDGTMADKVWTPEELTKKFNLDDSQQDMYYRTRQATDESLRNLTIDTISVLGKGTKLVNIHTVNKLKLEGLNPKDHKAKLQAGMVNELEKLGKGGLITPKAEARMQKQLDDVFKVMDAIADKSDKLIEQGYAPLMRFGHYAVEVRNKESNELDLFELYETKGEQDRAIKDLEKHYDMDEFTVDRGVLNPEGFKQFTDKGLSPETVQLFAAELGLDEDGAIQAYLKIAVSDRSALKRLIHRKKVPGYSEDMPRVLSAFVMSNARYSGRSLYNGEIEKSIQSIKDGNLQGEAQNVFDNMENPQEEFAGTRSMMFHYFMGFSLAFLTLNLTQPFTQTIPKLTAYVGVARAHQDMTHALGIIGKYMGKATFEFGKQAIGKPSMDWKGFEDHLPAWVKKEDYLRMSREGHLDPQNIWMIRGLERGKDGVLSGAWGNVERMAGAPAEVSESINRRSTMIAAFKVAKRMGDAKLKAKGFNSAYDFAVSVIQQTQGVYNKGNRSGLARGNGKLGQFGPLVMVFKQFSINYVEQMIRHTKDREYSSIAVAMGWQFMIAGMLGLPFTDDLRDIFEGFLYRFLGIATNLPDFLQTHLGKENADILMYGFVSQKTPIDMYGRSSMGNFIPGTSFARPQEGDIKEILGASSSFFQNFVTGGEMIATGQYKDGLVLMSPRYIKDAANGIDIWNTGAYRNSRGDKIMDMSKQDAVIKGLFQFNPAPNARGGRERSEAYHMNNMVKAKSKDIAVLLAAAMYQEDDDQIDKLYTEMDEWNDRNAEQYHIDIDKIEKSAEKRLEKKDFTSDDRQNIGGNLEEYLEDKAGT